MTGHPDINARFRVASEGVPTSDLTDAQIEQRSIQASIREAARAIVDYTPVNREQSLALTKLEEALMWAGKAIFA